MRFGRRRERPSAPGPRRTRSLPRRSPLAALGDHLALDATNSRIYWARARAGRGGLVLREWGSLDVPSGRSETNVLHELAELPWVRAAYLEVPLRSPGLKHRRLNLPAMTRAEGRAVARRRLDEFLREQSEDAFGCSMRSSGEGAQPLWLVATPASTPQVFETRWRSLGFQVHRLTSEPLALGNLARLLPPLQPGQLTALFDLRDEGGDCVVCDAHGWLFNRVIPLHRQGSAETSGEELHRWQLERMVTELRRTFQYVEQELQLGSVQRLVLSGTHALLTDLPEALSTALSLPASLIGAAIESGPGHGMDPAAARVVGLCAAPDPSGHGLLPPEVARARGERRARRQLVGLLAAVSAIALCAGTVSTANLWSLHRSANELRQHLSDGEEQITEVEREQRIRERAEELERAVAQLRPAQPPVASWLEVLRRLAPPDLALLALSEQLEGEVWHGTLTVEARGSNVSSAADLVAKFAETLGSVPLFAIRDLVRAPDDPQLQSQGTVRVQFTISGALAPMTARAQLLSNPASPDGARPEAHGDAAHD